MSELFLDTKAENREHMPRCPDSEETPHLPGEPNPETVAEVALADDPGLTR